MKSTPDWKLDCFSWLDLERWDAERLLTEVLWKGKRYCKVCDEWVVDKSAEAHAKAHKKEEMHRRKQRKQEGEKSRLEGLAAYHRERQLEKEVT